MTWKSIRPKPKKKELPNQVNLFNPVFKNLGVGDIKVINLNYDDRTDKYKPIDIAKSRLLGNPFFFNVKSDLERGESIRKYREKLWEELNKEKSTVKDEVYRIAKLVSQGEKIKLKCYCKPKQCHGDVLVSCITWLIKEGKV